MRHVVASSVPGTNPTSGTDLRSVSPGHGRDLDAANQAFRTSPTLHQCRT
jgi:hypothetical protein